MFWLGKKTKEKPRRFAKLHVRANGTFYLDPKEIAQSPGWRKAVDEFNRVTSHIRKPHLPARPTSGTPND